MAGKLSTSSIIAYALLGLFALPFAVVGLLSDLSLIHLGYDDVRMQWWNEVPCTILAAKTEEVPDTEDVSYRVTAKYRYTIDGIPYTGERLSLNGGYDTSSYQKQIQAELAEYEQSGKPFRCYVNPWRSEESILYRGVRWPHATMLTLAAITFSAVGFGLLGIVIAAWRDERRQLVPAAPGLKPWQTRADWVSGEIRHSDRMTGTVLVWLGAMTLLVSLPCLLASSAELLRNGGDVLAALGLLPFGLGLLLLRSGYRNRARWRRYGRSVLQLAAVPGVIGGRIVGAVRIERRVDSPAGFIVRLCCTETSGSSSSDDGPTSRVIWEVEQTVVSELYSATDGMDIPVLFEIPYDCRPTNQDPEQDSITWTVSIRSVTAGVDYQAQFDVPVFRTADSRENYAPHENEITAYQAPVSTRSRQKKAGVQSEPLVGGGERFVFPRGRNIGFVIGLALVQVAFSTGFVVLAFYQWTIAWPYLAALFGFFLLRTTVDLFLFRSEIEVTPAGLKLLAGIFNSGNWRDIPAAEIAKFETKAAGSAGSVSAHDLYVVLKSGKRVVLAKRIIPEAAANSAINRMRAILGDSAHYGEVHQA
jgi:hypothetical protein